MLYRPLVALTAASTISVLLLCFVMLATASRGKDRFEAVSKHLEILSRFEAASRELLEVADLGEERARLRAALAQLQASRDAVDASTTKELGPLFAAAQIEHRAIADLRAQALADLAVEARFEWWLVVVLSIVLTAGTLALFWEFRQRVLVPLDTLNRLLGTMRRRRYERADATDVSPSLRPLFESYNELVERVSQSEEAQARREAALRQELRAATRALMQQQVAISRGQRLAATGELAAQIAHDVRNPLAGILTAVENLRHDLEDEDARERLELVGDEVKRLARQLTGLVDAARQRVEPSKTLRLRETVRSLLSLTAYQVPPSIELVDDVPEGLTLRAPDGGLRQALLNLVLNAARAIGEASGTVTVTAACDEEHLQIGVEDTGAGFSDSALDAGVRAFATFSTSGSGLGLAAARRFATDLGGELEIGNLAQGGARVVIRLPVELTDG